MFVNDCDASLLTRRKSVGLLRFRLLKLYADVDRYVPSRRRLLFWALFEKPSVHLTSGWVLFDGNLGKVESIRLLIGKRVEAVDPSRLPRSIRHRLSALVLLFYLPRRREIGWAVLLAEVVADALRRPDGVHVKVFLWNPYFLWQYAISDWVGADVTYHLSCAYPRLRNVRNVLASRTTLDIMQYPPVVGKAVVGLPLRLGSTGSLSLFLSKLSVTQLSPTEQFMIDVARELTKRFGKQINLYPHPNDVRDENTLEEIQNRFEHLGLRVCPVEPATGFVADSVSVSAVSSVGLEMTGRVHAHFVVVNGAPHVPELSGDWRERAEKHLRARGWVLDASRGVDVAIDRLLPEFEVR